MSLPSAPKHSRIGASSAYRWMPCPGSVALCALLPPQKTNPAAEEGTAAHELGEACLRENRDAIDYVDEEFNGYVVTEEMAEAVQIYVDYIRSELAQTKGELRVEQRFHLKELHENLYGTNDACIAELFSTLHVIDYKHGRKGVVEVEKNQQLLYYALGAAMEMEFFFEKVKMTIVQPRALHKDGPIRSTTVTIDYLKSWAKDLLQAVRATEDPNAPRVAGDHCTHCPAEGVCPERRKYIEGKVLAKYNGSGEIVLPPVYELSPEQLGMVLASADSIESWVRQVRDRATERAKFEGIKIPGQKLVQRRTLRRFTAPEKVVEKLLPEFGDDIFSDPKLKSPAQIERLLGKKRIHELDGLVEKPEGELILVSDNDARESRRSLTADFTAITTSDDVFNLLN